MKDTTKQKSTKEIMEELSLAQRTIHAIKRFLTDKCKFEFPNYDIKRQKKIQKKANPTKKQLNFSKKPFEGNVPEGIYVEDGDMSFEEYKVSEKPFEGNLPKGIHAEEYQGKDSVVNADNSIGLGAFEIPAEDSVDMSFEF